MKSYLIKRLVHAVVVIYLVATIVFAAVRTIPGDTVTVLAGPDAPQSVKEALREELNLNAPIHEQYFLWMKNLAQGDLGRSHHQDQAVLDAVLGVVEPTLSIAVVGMTLALAIAIPAGIVSAVKRDSIEDYLATVIAFFGISMPSFWIGIILIVAIGSKVDFLATYGYTSFNEGIVPWMQSIVLPAVAVGLPLTAILTRFLRSSMMEVLNKEYMRTARAKGLSEPLVIFKHGIQNAFLPVLTMAGILLGDLLAGVVAVEIVFGYRGLGRLLIGSIERRDYPIVQGAIIMVSFVIVAMNLSVDVLYTLINPKIRYEGDE
jgi:peptide/nickel transport system permease protein